MAMACHASGGLLATAGADRKVLVWDVDGGFCTHYFKGHKDVVTTLMFHPDTNKTLVSSMQVMTTLLTRLFLFSFILSRSFTCPKSDVDFAIIGQHIDGI
jgi:WD40 repeat protein